MIGSRDRAGRCSTGWCSGATTRACGSIIDLHAAPGGQTGVNHDDGPGFPLTFYVPRYRALTIALWQKTRRPLSR